MKSSLENVFQEMKANNPCWSGEILTPNTTKYQEVKPIFSRRVQTSPSLVIRPRTSEEAALVVNWAWRHGIEIRIKGGGHSYEGYCSWNGVRLDTSLINHVKLCKDSRTMELGAGVLWRRVYEILDGTGLVAIGALVPTVGVVGFISGGGYNHALSRSFGMACDHTISFDIVMYNGKIVKNVSQTNHPDLWWALRGGGGNNFGLITQLKLDLLPASTDGSDQYFTYLGYYDFTDRVAALDFLIAWRRWTNGMLEKNECRMGADLEYDPEGKIRVWYVWNGGLDSKTQFEQCIADWKALAPEINNEKISTETWLEVCKSDRLPWDIPYPYEKRWWGPSAFFTDMSDQSLEKIVDQSAAVTTLLFEAGDLSRREEWRSKSSFPHRNGSYLITPLFAWENSEDDEKILDLGRSFMADLTDDPSWIGAYVNYIDAQCENWPQQYYGTSLSRLQQIKEKYDPDNYWNFPQSIPTKDYTGN